MDLKTLRAVKRLRQIEVAQAAGIATSKLSLIENGLIEPKESERVRIAKALNTAEDEINWQKNG